MLEECLFLAQKVAANRPINSDKYTGAASVSALYNPYKAEWIVSVSWSCSTKIEHRDISLKKVCEIVCANLRMIMV